MRFVGHVSARTIRGPIAALIIAMSFTTIVPAAAEDEVPGVTADDQTDATGSLVAGGVITAPSGTMSQDVVQSSYTTEVADTDETLAPAPMNIYTSITGSGSAVAGVVIDRATGAPVAAATVTMDNGQIGLGAHTATILTDNNGAFAITQIPADTYTVTVTAAGYGTYRLVNSAFADGQPYQLTVELTTDSQWIDDSALGNALTPTAGTGSRYPSPTRVPPTIRVGIYDQDTDCSRIGSGDLSYHGTVVYPWRYYVLHVAKGEIDTRWHIDGWKAVAAAIQNYAWYNELFPRDSRFDVNNTTDYQCFKPGKLPSSSWTTWVSDILNERVANSDGSLQLTQYRGSDAYSCANPTYGADSNILGQNGARGMDDFCGDGWRTIDNFFYTGAVGAGSAPPVPATSWSQISGGVRLNFSSQVRNSSLVAFNVGHHYQVDVYYKPPTEPYAWYTIYNGGWDSSLRNIRTTTTWQTTGCWKYRVRGSNPVGASAFGAFASNNTICPG